MEHFPGAIKQLCLHPTSRRRYLKTPTAPALKITLHLSLVARACSNFADRLAPVSVVQDLLASFTHTCFAVANSGHHFQHTALFYFATLVNSNRCPRA